MLTGIHFLLTYHCNFECDHCFLYCGPRAEGTFTVEQIQQLLKEAKKIDTVRWIYFEGGEPFLYYPLMVEGLRLAKEMGFQTGVVTNGYWALSEQDARLWLEPLASAGVDDLSVSDDGFHQGDNEGRVSDWVRKAADAVGLKAGVIRIEQPCVQPQTDADGNKGEPIVGGDVRFRGRAADTLIEGLPRKPSDTFTRCPDEDLQHPGRVHVDPLGNVHICQGLSIGDWRDIPLSDLMRIYPGNAENHPICGPLIDGGPMRLAESHGMDVYDDTYVDACHFCYECRKRLLEQYPEFLTPRQVYGMEDEPV